MRICCEIAIFAVVMNRVGLIEVKSITLRIQKNFGGGFEGDTMLAKVALRFLVIPLKLKVEPNHREYSLIRQYSREAVDDQANVAGQCPRLAPSRNLAGQ